MGLGLLSMPYAMRLSGWLGLAALAALTCLFCLSGKLIVHAFDKMPLHCAQTYPALGQYTYRASSASSQLRTSYSCCCLELWRHDEGRVGTGQLALGKSGQYLVAGFALSEFFGGGCMMLIVMWRIVMDMLPDQGTRMISAFCVWYVRAFVANLMLGPLTSPPFCFLHENGPADCQR